MDRSYLSNEGKRPTIDKPEGAVGVDVEGPFNLYYNSDIKKSAKNGPNLNKPLHNTIKFWSASRRP